MPSSSSPSSVGAASSSATLPAAPHATTAGQPPRDGGDPRSPPTSSIGGGGAATSKSSYSGDFWTLFFNGKSAIAEAFRKDPKLRGYTPAYVLGRMFDGGDPDQIAQWVNMNVKHIHYFSYRNRFPEPLTGGLDHDAGWGCMIRTGQMMLCEALRRCLPEAVARQTQHLFWDTASAPFGIHQFTDAGAKAHIPVGNWFSPTALAWTVKRLVAGCDISAPHMGVVIGTDGAVKQADIISEFVEHQRPALVLVPIMAGRDKIPADTQRAVLKTFQLPCTLGVVGGRPKHSLYFVGAQSDQLFFLDPHTVQPAFTSPETVGNASGVRGTMNASEMDPSMVLCFLLAKRRDLDEWERAFAEVINPLTEYPLFSIIKPKPAVSKGGATPGASPKSTVANGGGGGAVPEANDTPPSTSAAAAAAAAADEPRAAAPPAPQRNPAAASDDVADECDYDSDIEVEMQASPCSNR